MKLLSLTPMDGTEWKMEALKSLVSSGLPEVHDLACKHAWPDDWSTCMHTIVEQETTAGLCFFGCVRVGRIHVQIAAGWMKRPFTAPAGSQMAVAVTARRGGPPGAPGESLAEPPLLPDDAAPGAAVSEGAPPPAAPAASAGEAAAWGAEGEAGGDPNSSAASAAASPASTSAASGLGEPPSAGPPAPVTLAVPPLWAGDGTGCRGKALPSLSLLAVGPAPAVTAAAAARGAAGGGVLPGKMPPSAAFRASDSVCSRPLGIGHIGNVFGIMSNMIKLPSPSISRDYRLTKQHTPGLEQSIL